MIGSSYEPFLFKDDLAVGIGIVLHQGLRSVPCVVVVVIEPTGCHFCLKRERKKAFDLPALTKARSIISLSSERGTSTC